ncbi:MAG: hypothetical protein V1709_11350 [Planctomycetota bacterium]
MKKVFLIGSIVLNLAFIVVLAITFNKFWQKEKTFRNTKDELQQTKNQIDSITSENKQLMAKVSNLNSELLLIKNSLSTASQVSATATEPPITATAPTKSQTEKFLEALSTGTSVDERILKMKKIGKISVQMAKAQKGKKGEDDSIDFTPEMIGQMGEMMKIMSELGPEMEAMMKNDDNILLLPETRQFAVNLLAGMLEELGKPLSQEQMTQYESALTRLAEFDKKITQGAQNSTEEIIARLQNIEAINSITKELSIFTEEQKKALAEISGDDNIGMDMGIPLDDFASQITTVWSFSNENIKDQSEASKYILDDWLGHTKASAEQKDNLKPIAEQYVKDYTDLKKRMETTYDKNIMDYYLGKNKPTDTAKQGEYYIEREKLFQTNSDYGKAKTSLDIEFLKLCNNYYKQVATTVGSEKGAKILNREPQIVHFPNVE